MKKWLFYICILALNTGMAQRLPHPSAVFEWKMMPATIEGVEEERKLMDWPTETLDNFRIVPLYPAGFGNHGPEYRLRAPGAGG